MPQHTITTTPQTKPDAQLLSSLMEEVINPSPLAVTVDRVAQHESTWVVTAYFEDKPDINTIRPLLFDISGLDVQLSTSPLEQRNWVEDSLKGLAPVTAGRFCIYGEHDRGNHPKTGIELEINAGTAFGTGHHGTTTGCLLALEEISKFATVTSVLDIGCGTGVLAIAAARLLKVPAIASDIDPEAVRVTRTNAVINNASPFIRAITATGVNHNLIHSNAPYDLIFANILARPLIGLAPDAAPLLAPGGQIILSGLTSAQESWVASAWRAQGLLPIGKFKIDDWSTLVFHRP